VSNRTVTYSGADVTATTSHRVCRTGNWKKEINGLSNLVGNSGTVHGINSASAGNSWWKSVVMNANGAPLSEDIAQQIMDGVGSSGNGEVEIMLTTRGIRRRYVNTLKSQKRFTD